MTVTQETGEVDARQLMTVWAVLSTSGLPAPNYMAIHPQSLDFPDMPSVRLQINTGDKAGRVRAWAARFGSTAVTVPAPGSDAVFIETVFIRAGVCFKAYAECAPGEI